jgi:hypothetical protein
MRFKQEDRQPQRNRSLRQIKRTFNTKSDARWRGVPCRTADAAGGYMRRERGE